MVTQFQKNNEYENNEPQKVNHEFNSTPLLKKEISGEGFQYNSVAMNYHNSNCDYSATCRKTHETKPSFWMSIHSVGTLDNKEHWHYNKWQICEGSAVLIHLPIIISHSQLILLEMLKHRSNSETENQTTISKLFKITVHAVSMCHYEFHSNGGLLTTICYRITTSYTLLHGNKRESLFGFGKSDKYTPK